MQVDQLVFQRLIVFFNSLHLESVRLNAAFLKKNWSFIYNLWYSGGPAFQVQKVKRILKSVKQGLIKVCNIIFGAAASGLIWERSESASEQWLNRFPLCCRLSVSDRRFWCSKGPPLPRGRFPAEPIQTIARSEPVRQHEDRHAPHAQHQSQQERK